MDKEIAFVINGFPHTSETFIVNQLISAIKGGWDVAILANNLLDINNSSQQELLQQYKLIEATFISPLPPGSIIKRIAYFIQIFNKLPVKQQRTLLGSFNVASFRRGALTLETFFHGARFVGHENYHIYHAQYGPNGRSAVIAKQLGIIRGSIITTFHGYDAHHTETNEKSLKKFYQPLFSHGDLFTANTPYLADQLRHLGCPTEKITILPMGIDTTFFTPQSPPPKQQPDLPLRLLSVGRLIDWKGHHHGIEVIKKLVMANHRVHYTIIGDGPEKGNLVRLINRLGLTKYVRLTGAKSQQDVRDEMRNSDIFLMTSTCDKSGRRETQGMVSGEAQACGLPVVAFQSGGVGYTLKHGVTGLLVTEEDVDGFVQAVITLINTPLMRGEMGRAGVSFIRRTYSLEATGRALCKLYDNANNFSKNQQEQHYPSGQ